MKKGPGGGGKSERQLFHSTYYVKVVNEDEYIHLPKATSTYDFSVDNIIGVVFQVAKRAPPAPSPNFKLDYANAAFIGCCCFAGIKLDAQQRGCSHFQVLSNG